MGISEDIGALKALLEQEKAHRLIAEQALIKKNKELAELKMQMAIDIGLHATTNRVAALMNNLSAGILVENEKGRIQLINNSFCQIFNTSSQASDLIDAQSDVAFRQVASLFKAPEAFIDRLNNIVWKKEKVLNEICELADGRILERDYIPVFYEDNYQGHLWEYRDVTQKVMDENRLEQQRKFYENVLNNIPADIAVFDAQHKYLYINPVAIKDEILRKWMIGKTDREYHNFRNKPVSSADRRDYVFDQALQTKQLYSWEEKLVNKKGETEYHYRNLYPVLNDEGEVDIIIGYGLNITERKLIEEQLYKNEKRYRDLFNYSQALICTHDMHGRILSVNPSICTLLGYTENELVGRLLTDFIPAKDVANFEPDYLFKVTTTGKSKGVFRVLNKSGKQIFLLYENYKVEEDGTEPYIIGFSQDITERIKAEKELLIAKQMTEQASKAKEIFLANMSHEIRTPMNGVLGVARLLDKTYLNTEQKNYVKLITESANNLMVIVNDVLDVEKIASGKFELEHLPFRLADKISLTMQPFEYKAEEKLIALKFENLLPEGLVVVGDPYRLGQVMNNLIGNALKFTHNGKIVVTAKVEKEEDNNIIIVFSVADSGIGISEDRLGDIFNPFVQASTDITRKYGGTGLGLSICKSLVEMQGGVVSVKSIVNEGTTFSFSIRYGLGDASMLEGEPEEDIITDTGIKKVLVAEDVVLNQFLVKHMLENWGIEVDIANNGLEALDKVRGNDYDVILMDIQMPEMDGITATAIIREMKDKQKATIPIIALTANALKGDSDRYLKAGMNGYISKPYTETMLYAALKSAANNKGYAGVKEEDRQPVVPEHKSPAAILVEDKTESLYDLTLLWSVANDDEAFIRKVLATYMDTVPADIDRLEDALAENDWNTVGKQAHKLKPAIDYMGIKALKNVIRKMEAIPDDINEYNRNAKILKETMAQVFEQFRKDFPGL
jgi:PAS domain S-box-containing protein